MTCSPRWSRELADTHSSSSWSGRGMAPSPVGTRDLDEDARLGVSDGARWLGSLVHEPAIADASEIDKSFLLAMAKDDGPSKMADIQGRLNVDVNYASQYRLRLIAAELIEPVRRGYVDFALPYLREYLRSHAASEM